MRITQPMQHPTQDTSMSDLAARVMTLIIDIHQGSVNEASRAMDLEQSTLQRIVKRQTKRPSARVLSQIATFYDVPVRWLAEGKGPLPKFKNQRAELYEWEHIIRGLGVGTEGREALWSLPNAIMEVAYNMFGPPSAKGSTSYSTPEINALSREELRLWIRLFRELIARLGTTAVRDWVDDNPERLRRW